MNFRKLTTLSAFLGTALAALPVLASATWSPWFSEDTTQSWRWCGTGEAVSGVRCSGSYCDNLSIRCETMPFGITGINYHWSQFFSEESANIATSVSHPNPNRWYTGILTHNLHVCNAGGSGGIVTGMSCAGSYCDRIAIECATPMAGSVPAQMSNCAWSGWYSDEDNGFAYGVGSNRFVTAVECSGRYCDNKRFHVCSVQPPANSCVGHCGGTSSDLTCFCDALCTGYGDCCGDYAPVCQ